MLAAAPRFVRLLALPLALSCSVGEGGTTGFGSAEGGDDAEGTGSAAGQTAGTQGASAHDAPAGDTSGGSTTAPATSGPATGDATAGDGESGEDSGGRQGCTVAADGCCSDLLLGGTDPDCAAMDCQNLAVSTPILLPDFTDPNDDRRGGTAMAWTGEDLYTMRLDVQDETWDSDWWFVLERRDPAGALIEEITEACDYATCNINYGPTSLAYHRDSRRLMFAYPHGFSYRYRILDDDGSEVDAQAFGVKCNGETANIEVTRWSGGFALGWDDYDCGFPGERSAWVQRFDPDGGMLASTKFGDNANYASFACGADCDAMVSIHAQGAMLAASTFDAVSEVVANDLSLTAMMYGGVDYTEVAFDGTSYFVVDSERPASTSRLLTTGRWDPVGGWLSPRVTIPAGARGLPPSLVWTGDGYVLAVATFDTSYTMAFPNRSEFSGIEIFHFAPDGTLRQRFMLEGQPGLFPQLTYAGGQVALSWVRWVGGSLPEERYLAFLSCAN